MEQWMGPIGRLFAPAVKEPFEIGVYPEQPHLKSLAIEMEDIMEMARFPLTWLELFSQFPSLTRLSEIVDMSNIVGEEDHPFPINELLSLLEAIRTIRNDDPGKLALKKVVLEPTLNISHDQKSRQILNLSMELSLPLEALKLCMDGMTQLQLNELAGAAGIDSRPLRSLTVYKTEAGISNWKFRFADPLDNLEVLIMGGGIIWENMGWSKLVPNLFHLEITDETSVPGEYRDSQRSLAMISKTVNLELIDIKLLKMKSITCNYALSKEDIRRLASWFPNLTRLHMVLDDKLVAVVCEQWPDLEVLTVIGAQLTDEGVTGLRAGQELDEPDTSKEHAPNLTLLQKLRYFIFTDSEKISDVSVFNGFVKLPNLQYLRLGKTTGLSDKAKAALKENEDIHLKLD